MTKTIKKGYFAINPIEFNRQSDNSDIATLNTIDRMQCVIQRLLNQGFKVLEFHSQPGKKPVINIEYCAKVEKFPNVEIVRKPGGVKGREKLMASVMRGVQVQWRASL